MVHTKLLQRDIWFIQINVPVLTNKVRWKLEETVPNMSLPTTVAIVGVMRAPQRTRVAEMGSESGAVSAGIREYSASSVTKTGNITEMGEREALCPPEYTGTNKTMENCLKITDW